MANFCHQCSQAVTSVMRVCPNCGTLLAATATATATATAPYAPPPYTPPPDHHVAYAPPFPPTDIPAGLVGNVYPKASLGARFVASLVDGLVGVAAMAPGFTVMVMGGAGGGLGSEEALLGGSLVGVLLLIAGAMWSVWYAFTKDGRTGGASIGKRMMGLMVVHLPTDLPCTRGQSAVRALVLFLLNMVPLVGWLIEPIAVIAADDGRRLGDRAADTQVISIGSYAE